MMRWTAQINSFFSSSLKKGARRAWGLACALLVVLLLPAAAVQAAAPGTVIANTAQAAYRTHGSDITVTSPAATIVTQWPRTTARIELLQYAPGMSGAEQVSIPVTGFDPDGTGGGTPQQISSIHPAGSVTPIDLARTVPLVGGSIYHQGEPVFFRVTDADQNIDPVTVQSVYAQVSTAISNDVEILLLSETGPDTGVFAGYIQSAGVGPVQTNNGILDVGAGEQFSVRYTDVSDASDSTTAAALVDPYGRVFDSATGLPVNDIGLTLVDAATDSPAMVYGDDGFSTFPASITSGGSFTDSSGKVYTFAAGAYRFPFVPPGSYRLVASPPPGYAAPSTVAEAVLQTLPGAPFAVSTPGSYGEVFVLNPGPAVRLDVPVDPTGVGLWLRKTVNREVAAIGDFVQYTVTIENRSGRPASGVVATDRLPEGFRLRPGSTRVDGQTAADPLIGAAGREMTFDLGDVADGRTVEIRYVAEITAGAKPGKAENRIQASASGGLNSNSATAAITIKEELFRGENFIAGRVMVDNCGDVRTDSPDGVAGVRIYLEDGTYVITDEQGMYHIEAVTSGTHVVQLDLASIPADYEISACGENDRQAGTSFSRFVDLHGGALWREDFHLQNKTPPSGQALSPSGARAVPHSLAERRNLPESRVTISGKGAADAATESPPVQKFENIDVNTLRPGLAWVMPAPDFYPHIPSVKLAVQHLPGQSVDLMLDDRLVSALNYDGAARNRDGTVEVSFWRGVDIHEGDNRFVAVCKDGSGRETGRIERTVHYSGPPVNVQWVPEQSHLLANGKDVPVVAVRLSDKAGRPARFGLLGEYTVSEPFQAYAPKEKLNQDSLTRIEDGKSRYTVGRDGIARIRLDPTTRSGPAVIQIPLADKVHEVRVWVQPEVRDWILVGLAEGTAGFNTVSGNMESLAAEGDEEDLYQDGRLAFFAKGRVKGRWLLTMAYDSSRGSKDLDNRLFQTVDPDTYYTLYGDAARQQYEASSVRKLYLKIERDQFYALFGDFDTGLTVTELSRYSRRFNGFKSAYESERFGYSAFVADTDQAFVKDEIRGDGTSGLYRLSRKGIAPNSDTVVIETRDRFHSENIVNTQRLTRFIDYAIDYDAGTLFFKAPVFSRDENFNPIYIVAEYERDDSSETAFAYGGRGSVKLADGKVEVGATYIHDGPENAAGRLAGVDAGIDLGDGLRIKAEAAETSKQDEDGDNSGRAYMAEIHKQSADLDARLYLRELGRGFGLGQQNGGEVEMRKIGAEGAWRLKENWKLSGEFYRQSNLATNARRDLGEARVEFKRPVYSLFSGLRLADDRYDGGRLDRSDQVIVGGSRRFMDSRLQTRLSHEQSVGGANESADFPTRTILGADFKVVDPLTLFAEHEITQAESEDTQSSRLGAKASPWNGGQVGSSLGRQFNENGQRLYANLGLSQTWRINDRWSVDGGLDRTQTIHHDRAAKSINPSVPTAAGAQEDFTAISLGAGYRADNWSWNVRLEGRDSESEDKLSLITGLAGEVRRGLGLSAGLQLFSAETEAGTDTLQGDLRFSLALRPKNTRWIVLDRLEYKFEDRQDLDGDLRARRIVNNLNANYKPHQKLQLGMQYAAKYVFDAIDGADYSGFTDLTGLEARYDLSSKWDLGLHGSVLHSWNAGRIDYRTGLSLGYALIKNMWVSLGYNFTGFRDEDFSRADFTAAGPFVKFRIKFDQQSVREMVNWFAD